MCMCAKFQFFQFIKSTLKYHARKNFYTYVSFPCIGSIILESRYRLSDKRLTGVFGLYVSIDRGLKQQNLITFKRTRTFSAPRFCPRARIAGNFQRRNINVKRPWSMKTNCDTWWCACIKNRENVGRVAPFMFTTVVERQRSSFINNWMPNVKSASKIHAS